MSCPIEIIEKIMLQLLPIIYITRIDIYVPIKDIFFKRSSKLLDEIITECPRISASLNEVCYMLFRISFAIKLLGFRRLISIWKFYIINLFYLWENFDEDSNLSLIASRIKLFNWLIGIKPSVERSISLIIIVYFKENSLLLNFRKIYWYLITLFSQSSYPSFCQLWKFSILILNALCQAFN